ncbi:hypothetical protein [Syntrophotalea acetylenica]|jgi:DNA repair ATPase RecN|uniref:hypothetical protein n=1 Tax=Syntrophotalea acetylenica TaxID=29542 RepID=UPI001EB0D2E4|nr:hypothetical protein [Syntrophotalea acetylenica]MDY0261558.1 hypothetical protein [Syntrophotalea acetylenica]NCA99965.1 hypothetical protein [Clostridia bacterium]
MEKLVEKSTRQYRAIGEQLDRLAELLQERQADALQEALQQWHALDEEARQTDRQLMALLQTAHPTPRHLAALHDRNQLMFRICHRCQELLQRARTLQALTGEELARLKNGRKALGGYRASSQGMHHSTLGSC